MMTQATPLDSYSNYHRSSLAQRKQATYPVTQIQPGRLSHMRQENSHLEDKELMTFFCRALYDFEAQDSSALSFRHGDVMEVLTQEPSGWWDGLLRDERGWFPSNYVEVISDDEAKQALLFVKPLAVETLVQRPLSTSSMLNMSQTVKCPVDQEANERWLRNELLASRKSTISASTSVEKSKLSDHWIRGVRSDGQVFYVNNQNGPHLYAMPRDGDEYRSDSESAGLVSQTLSSGTRDGLFTSRKSLISTVVEQDSVGPGILRRPPTPEPWDKKLHEDGKSHSHYNKVDGRILRTLSEVVDNTTSKPVTSPLRQKAANSSIRHSSQYSNDLVRHSRKIPVRTPTTNRVLSKLSSESHTRPTALANTLPEYTITEHISRSLQQLVAPSLPEGITELAINAESVVQSVLDNIRMNGFARRPEEDAQLNDLLYDVVLVVRNLVYALAVPTIQIPQNVLPREVRHLSRLPQSPLKPAQRKVTATLSQLILSARAIQYDSGLSIADILSRLENDTETLRKDVFVFIRQVQELKHSSKLLTRYKYPKRLHGTFNAQNVGPGLVGAGAAGRWKGFGWISLDEEQAASRRTLGLEVISQLEHALNNLNIEFQSFLQILRTPHQSPVEQVRLSGRELVAQVSSFVNFIFDIHVARHVDVDGLLQDGTGPYGLTIESAQRLVRNLEAVTQAVNDDTSVFLLTLQSVPAESHLPQYRKRRNHAWNRLSALVSALSANMTVLLDTVRALFSLGHKQAELSLGDYNGSIEWRMSRLSLRRALSTNSVDDSSGVARDAPKAFVPYKWNNDPREGLESLNEQISASNMHPLEEDEGETKVMMDSEESVRPDDERVFYNRKSPGQGNSARKPNGSLGDKKEIVSEPWYLCSNYNEMELLIAYDNTVKGGTLPALVERLTAHDKVDPSFNRAFLMTFKSFMTVNDLFNLLFARFQVEPPPDLKPDELESWKRHKQQLVQLRVINTFIMILKDDSILKAEDLHILERLKAFISSDKVSRVGAAKEVLVYIERLNRNDNNILKVVMPGPSPPLSYPKTTRKLKITEIKPFELARQLTLVESSLYRKIKFLECLQRAREQKVEIMDNIANIIQMSNRIADWVAECVLSREDARKRATIVKHLISVADCCRTLNNFSSMAAIITGLTTQPIHRLKRTWELVGQQSMEQFTICESTVECIKSLSKYRQVMDLVNPPCVPFIGGFLSALKRNHYAAPDMLPGGLVNFRKRQRAFEVITEITRWQAQPFNIQPIPPIQTLIEESLSRYNDTKAWSDRFWDLSTELEPREREDEKMARLLQESGFL